MATGNTTGERYRQEAQTFIGIMRDLAPDLRLDYSAKSIKALERFIAENFDPPNPRHTGQTLPMGVGCYLGETIVRTLGGKWDPSGRPEISNLGEIRAIYPLDRALKRFDRGREASLTSFYDTVKQYARSKNR